MGETGRYDDRINLYIVTEMLDSIMQRKDKVKIV